MFEIVKKLYFWLKARDLYFLIIYFLYSIFVFPLFVYFGDIYNLKSIFIVFIIVPFCLALFLYFFYWMVKEENNSKNNNLRKILVCIFALGIFMLSFID